ncbi:cupredoxin domain-containing protein [Leucobacter chromiiresistens]|uniref:cupredoxin domain-containing protein n=1 Tax=Leucobacter chromiiresistens TaxID=1079994 RepID=UPI0002629EFA|nr:cupredoxin domain-containing protein [Leucobacter chromiiresistens]
MRCISTERDGIVDRSTVDRSTVDRGISRRRLLSGAAGVFGAGAAAVLAGCAPAGKPDPVPSDDDVKAYATVTVVDNRFEPAEVEIAPQQAVRWVFVGPGEHDVVADDRGFVSELLVEGSYTHQFTEEGEYPYLCSIHPEMRGVVRVVAP